jgi:hypothetical protein
LDVVHLSDHRLDFYIFETVPLIFLAAHPADKRWPEKSFVESLWVWGL